MSATGNCKGRKEVVKQRVVMLCLAISFMALISACQAGGTNSGVTASNATASPQARAAATPSAEEIRAVLAAHDKALNEKNLDALMATFSTDPTTVVLGLESKSVGWDHRRFGPHTQRCSKTTTPGLL